MIARTFVILLLTALVAGAQTRVRIQGLQTRPEAEVLDLMGGRLVHVHSDPASASRADDAAFILRQLMEQDGYANVDVTWRVVHAREILLSVREGGRLSLGQVEIRGEPAEDARRLSQIYSRPATQNRPFGAGPAPFREDDIEDGLALIVQDLQAMGHWAAEAALVSQSVNPADGFVDLIIDVARGPLFRIGEPVISSADGRGVVRAGTTAAAFVGQPASTGNLNSMKTAVQEAFTSRGYPDVRVLMNRALEGSLFVPEFSFDLGQRVRLNRVFVEGLQRTNPSRVRQRVSALEGDWYNEAAMNRRLRQLLATGAFSSARVETEEITPRTINAILRMEEARAKEVSFAAGFGSFEGGIFRVGYSDRNFLGQLRNFTSGFEISSRGLLGEVSLTDPWLFGSDYSLSGRLYALSRSHEGYDTFETGLGLSSSRTFGNYSVELSAGWSIVNLSAAGLPRAELGETVYNHTRVGLVQVLDFRDSAILPTKGWHLRWPLQVGSAIGDNTTSYFSTGLEGGWYHRFNRTWQIGLGGEAGMLVPTGDGTDLPIDLRLFTGGARSVRSFPERRLGPSSVPGNYPTGGEAFWVANAELVRALAGPLKVVGFADVGALARDYPDIGAADIELALGLGLRLDLPVGPVRLEYGHNMTRDAGEPSGTWHFAIGITF